MNSPTYSKKKKDEKGKTQVSVCDSIMGECVWDVTHRLGRWLLNQRFKTEGSTYRVKDSTKRLTWLDIQDHGYCDQGLKDDMTRAN